MTKEQELIKNLCKCLEYFVNSVTLIPATTPEEDAEYEHYDHLAREFIKQAKGTNG